MLRSGEGSGKDPRTPLSTPSGGIKTPVALTILLGSGAKKVQTCLIPDSLFPQFKLKSKAAQQIQHMYPLSECHDASLVHPYNANQDLSNFLNAFISAKRMLLGLHMACYLPGPARFRCYRTKPHDKRACYPQFHRFVVQIHKPVSILLQGNIQHLSHCSRSLYWTPPSLSWVRQPMCIVECPLPLLFRGAR